MILPHHSALHSIYARHPELRGAVAPRDGAAAMCTSQPDALEFLRAAVAHLFREAPELDGVFTISMSENPTHCHARGAGRLCPRCAGRPPAEIVAEVNRTIAEAARAVKPDARVIVSGLGAGRRIGRMTRSSGCRRTYA